MNREEQIRQASIEYTLKNRPMCIGGDDFAELADELNRNSAFEEGAKWADKNPINIWHDREDIPKPNSWILIQNNKGGYDTLKIMSCMPSSNWSITCKVSSIYKWAYVSDLIPKREFDSSYEKIE